MAGAHGGARPGAGRKKGVRNRKTQALIDKAEAEGIMPLEILVRTARHFWDEGTDKRGKIIDPDKARIGCEIAKDAAPYLHPRLNAVDFTGDMTLRHEDALKDLE